VDHTLVMTLCKASLIGFSAPFRSSAVMPSAPAARPFFNAMSTKRVFEKITKTQRSYVPLCGGTTFVLLTVARTVTVINNITIFCNDVNNTSTSVELLAINILHYMSQRSNVGLGTEDLKPLWKSGMDITPLRIHSIT